MKLNNLYSLTLVLFLAVFVDAQTGTVVDAAGATVVELVTQNAAGVPVTQILQTLTGGLSPSSALTATALTATSKSQTATLALTTSTTSQIGPVGQPASGPATPGGPTPYDYTTTNAAGQTVVMQGIFTPTGPQTVLPAPTTTGTVVDYSQWLSAIGTYTAPASAARRLSMATGWYYLIATAFAGLIGGAWVIIL